MALEGGVMQLHPNIRQQRSHCCSHLPFPSRETEAHLGGGGVIWPLISDTREATVVSSPWSVLTLPPSGSGETEARLLGMTLWER